MYYAGKLDKGPWRSKGLFKREDLLNLHWVSLNQQCPGSGRCWQENGEKSGLIAETGAGQYGVATGDGGGSPMDMELRKVYMGKEDMEPHGL